MVPLGVLFGLADGERSWSGSGVVRVLFRVVVVCGWFSSTSPKAPVMKVETSAPSALTVAKMSPWMFGRLYVVAPALVLWGLMVTNTSPGRVRYFCTTVPLLSVRKSGVSPEPVKP